MATRYPNSSDRNCRTKTQAERCDAERRPWRGRWLRPPVRFAAALAIGDGFGKSGAAGRARGTHERHTLGRQMERSRPTGTPDRTLAPTPRTILVAEAGTARGSGCLAAGCRPTEHAGRDRTLGRP